MCFSGGTCATLDSFFTINPEAVTLSWLGSLTQSFSTHSLHPDIEGTDKTEITVFLFVSYCHFHCISDTFAHISIEKANKQHCWTAVNYGLNTGAAPKSGNQLMRSTFGHRRIFFQTWAMHACKVSVVGSELLWESGWMRVSMRIENHPLSVSKENTVAKRVIYERRNTYHRMIYTLQPGKK